MDNIQINKSEIKLSNSQQKILDSLNQFIKSNIDNELLLIGYAGTGKTTLITKFINDLIDKKICNRIVIAAPTHKAVNIAKSKLFSSSNQLTLSSNIDIMTIHRLLNYQNYIDTNGETFFAKSAADTNWSIYDLVVVDESSMLSNQIINDIITEINKPLNKKLKVIYVGDPAQLPPVNQSDSKIFNRKIKKLTLDEIIRTNCFKIMELSNAHRKWIETNNDNDIPILTDYQSDKIIIYPNDKYEEWLNKFITITKLNNKNLLNVKIENKKLDNFDNLDNNIILTWTNKKSNKYNQYVREKLFNKKDLDRYELGEILIFNDFYRLIIEQDNPENIETKITNKIITFYTSEQVKLCKIKQDKYKFEKLKNLKNKEIPENISDKFIKKISSINKKLNNIEVDVYFMNIQKISDLKANSVALEYDILSIHYNSEQIYKKLIEYFEEEMIKLKNDCYTLVQNIKNVNNMIKCDFLSIIDKKINRIWKEWQTNVIDKFAQLNYGYAITVHKSQGSTFKNVFIDISDIFDNLDIKETLKCLYTAITRSSNSLELLI